MVHRFYPEVGGIEMTAELLARGFVERHGAEVILVTHNEEGPNPKEFPFKVLREPSRLLLWKTIAGADVVFHNNPCMQFYWPQFFIRKPWVVVLRQWMTLPSISYSLPQKIKNKLKYELVKRADVLISNSKSTAGHISAPSEIIYNSYRDSIFTITNTELRERTSLVYLGRLSDDKGIDLLIQAVEKLHEQEIKAHLTLIGDGPYEADLRELTRNLQLEDYVKFTGKLHGVDAAEELNKHAISVVPTIIEEAFGTVVLEEMGAGCVPLVSNIGGLPEAAGEAGAKFEPRNLEDLTYQLKKLITDDEYYEGFKSKIPSHLENFRENIFVDKFYEAIERAYRKVNKA